MGWRCKKVRSVDENAGDTFARVSLVWLDRGRTGARRRDVDPRPDRRRAGAAELAGGDVGESDRTYTDALKDTGLPNDRRATILNDRAVVDMRLG